MLRKSTQPMLCFVLLSLINPSFGNLQPAKLEPLDSKPQEIELDSIPQVTQLGSKSQEASEVLALQLINKESQIDYVSVAYQLINKENSPLGLTTTVNLYEFDQIFIIQRHVDSISIEFLQVFLHFTVKATCKPYAPACADEMRRCRAHFCLNRTEIEDDVTHCEPLPFVVDGAFDAENEPSSTVKESKNNAEPGLAKAHDSNNPVENALESLIKTYNDHSILDINDSQSQKALPEAAQKTKYNVGPQYVMSPKVNDPTEEQEILRSLLGGSENPTQLKDGLEPSSSLRESQGEPQETKDNVRPKEIVGLEPKDPIVQKELESILGLEDLSAVRMQNQVIPNHKDEDHHKKHTMEANELQTKDTTELPTQDKKYSMERIKDNHSGVEHISPLNVIFLDIANSLVGSINNMNPDNNHNLTLVKVLGVKRHSESAEPTYTLTVMCDHDHGSTVCDITCTIERPWYKPPQLLNYECQLLSSGDCQPEQMRASSNVGKPLTKDTPSFNNDFRDKDTDTANGNLLVNDIAKQSSKTNSEEKHHSTTLPKDVPIRIKMIAESVMIQMDEIDLDNYRRVLLNVTNVREELTYDGSGLQYSMSMVMVSTDCVETNSLQDMEDSESCLENLASPQCPQQLCDVNCVNPIISDDGPRLVSSECRPIPSTKEEDRWAHF